MPDIRFYLSLFFRRLHYFLILVALGASAGITLAVILPPQYVAQARLVVESEQIPDELAASTVRTAATEQLQIIQQRILTRDILLDMANSLGVYRDAAQQPGEQLQPDEIVSDMRNRINIRTTGGGSRRDAPEATLVTVSFSADRADLAAQVTNRVVSLILEENVRVRTGTSGQTLEFFQQEVARLDQELSDRGARIIAFQEENRGALPDSLDFRRSRLAAAQERLLQLQRDEAALNDRRASLVDLYERTGQVGMQGGTQSSEQAQLNRLREQYTTSLAVMSPENPRIRVMRAQIDALERTVAEQAAEAGGTAGQRNADGSPLTTYEMQLADLDNQLEFLSDRREEIDAEMEALSTSIDQTPSNSVTLQTLQRDYDNLRLQYDQAIANRARAETGDMIEAMSKGQRISVIEQAVAPREPNSPNRPKIAAAGVGGGIAAGLGLILLLEFLNTSIRRPVDIVKKLDLMPFATLSFIRTEREIRRRRALITAAFALVLAGLPIGLWAVNAYVMPLDLLMDEVMQRLPIAIRRSVLPITA
ncbi:polysaccharide chain length determinant protein (PEP-CTERM system associated) [Palleronia aestuarii]|uniref:Polysaccharide chain length determinant protein (PEP-CTERM system associated) n=1 Tax=Palleronia aestuarii TaxID=568105 RepID=A0A2W7N0B4_9RHOB|nr:lipopolysaccharide biosynthesis protein [Palleronia aestuarii]PZX13510.1 polysaccharide chain length determinant protein (PEP-CTERM system associated) [Palleronia aestuarii]